MHVHRQAHTQGIHSYKQTNLTSIWLGAFFPAYPYKTKYWSVLWKKKNKKKMQHMSFALGYWRKFGQKNYLVVPLCPKIVG